MYRFFTSIIMIGLVLTGCNNTQPKPQAKSKYEKPEWVNNAQGGAVGSCASHMNGNAAQEEVALNRAITQLAKSKKASVVSKSTGTQKQDGLGYSSTNTNNTEVSTDAQVSSTVKAKWRDPKSNMFYIWIDAQ